MAKNISLMGASYSDVPTVTLPQTGGGTARFDDASVTTAVAADVAQGKVFLAADGTITTGTGTGGGIANTNTKIDSDVVCTTMRGSYRVASACYDSTRNVFCVIGGSTSKNGDATIFTFSDWRHPDNVTSSAVIQTGHSNSIAYNSVTDKYMVACGGGTSSGELAYDNQIAIVDPDTLTVTDRIQYTSGIGVQGIAFCGDSVCVHLIPSQGDQYFELKSTDLSQVIQTATVSKTDVINRLGIAYDADILGQSLTYDSNEEIIYRVFAGHPLDYHDLNYDAYWKYGILAGYRKDDLTLVKTITFSVNDKEEVESYIFGDKVGYILSDGVQAVYRIAPSMFPATKGRTWIPANSNLNNYYGVGDYFSHNAANSASISNTPVTSSGFTLFVRLIGNEFPIQFVIGVNGTIFKRIYDHGWKNWYSLSQTQVN